MDELHQLGAHIRDSREDSEDALRRFHPTGARVDRSRDIFDSVTPFEMFFNKEKNEGYMELNLVFFPAPNTCCCTICTCSICEFFTGQTSPVITLSHDILEPTSVKVYFNDIRITNFVITGDAEITLTISLEETDEVKVCYVWEIPINGPTKCSDAAIAIAGFTFDPLTDGDFELKAGQVGFSSDGTHLTGGVGAAVICTLHGPYFTETDSGTVSEVTWAQATIPGWFGGPLDKRVSEIPIINLLSAVDGDCGTKSYRDWAMYRGAGCVDTFWEFHFNQPVSFCRVANGGCGGEVPYGISLFVTGGDWGEINTDVNIGGGSWSFLADHNITASAIRIYFRDCASDGYPGGDFGGGHVGPFTLWYGPPHEVPEFQVELTGARCIDLLAAGLIDENWQITPPDNGSGGGGEVIDNPGGTTTPPEPPPPTPTPPPPTPTPPPPTNSGEIIFPINLLTVGPMPASPGSGNDEWDMFSGNLYSPPNPFSAVLDPAGSGHVVVKNINRLSDSENHTTYGTSRDMPKGNTSYAAFSWLWQNSTEFNPVGWTLIWQRQMVGSPIAALSVEHSTKRWFMSSRDNTVQTKYDITPVQYGHWAFCVVGIHLDDAPAGWVEWWFSHDRWPDVSQSPLVHRGGIQTWQGAVAHDTMGMYAAHFAGSAQQYIGYGYEYGRAASAARAIQIARKR